MVAKLTIEKFIEISNKRHNYMYDYSQVEYVNNKTPVTITCPIHGTFTQRPDSHMQGKGCYFCGLDSQKNAVFGFGCNDMYHTQGTP